MKKIFFILVIFISFLIILDVTNTNNKLYKKIDEEKIYIDELYIYGRYLNIKGHSNFNFENTFLVFIDNNFNEKLYDVFINNNEFYISDKINGGLNLEEIDDSFTILLKNNDKYYSFINMSSYKKTDYYSLNKNNKSNYLLFYFDKFKDAYFLKLDSKIVDTPSDVYDIVIDPGHGGYDVGAINGSVYESNINLSISLKLKEKLEENGFKVKLTRDDNTNPNPYGKNGRATSAYETKSKLFISVHVNSSSNPLITGGVEVYASKNMNYDFAYNLASKVKEYANTTFSPLQAYKVKDGVYVKTLTESEIKNAKVDAENNGYSYYENVTTDTPWYFYNRETGGYMTGAYMDGRNKLYPKNDYYNSNMGVEGYLLELGYITCKKDLDNLVNNQDGYVTGIVKAFVEKIK